MKRLLRSRWFGVFLLTGVPVVWGIWKWHRNGALVAAIVILAAFWALVLAFLESAGQRDGNPHRSRYGFLDVIIGADGRVSTSKTVAYGWTATFASALVVMASLAVSGRLTPAQAFQTGSNWDAYLLLLGAPTPRPSSRRGSSPTRPSRTPAPSPGPWPPPARPTR
jgi:hypothetical protein